MTEYLDICYERSRENLDRPAQALLPFKPKLRGVSSDIPFKLDLSALRQGALFTLTTDAGALDLLAELSGIGGYEQAISDATKVQIFGIESYVASLETIIRSKKAAGRRKDLNAIPELEFLLERQSRSTED